MQRANDQQDTKQPRVSVGEFGILLALTLITVGLGMIWLPLSLLFLGLVAGVIGLLALAREQREQREQRRQDDG